MGDHGGAERTGEALQDLLRIHLNAARRSRQAKVPAGEPLPVTPALKDTVDALTAHLRDSTSATELNVLSELLQRIVQLGDKSDAAVDADRCAPHRPRCLRTCGDNREPPARDGPVVASEPTTGATSGRYKMKHANATYKAM